MRFGVAVFVITVIGAGAAGARETSPERKALQRYCTGDLVTFCDGMENLLEGSSVNREVVDGFVIDGVIVDVTGLR